MKRSNIHIGTSGWHYDHWIGRFYPEDIDKPDMLDYYCHEFETAEINNSFYQLPDRDTLRKWRDAAPDNFIFSVKGSRYITHMKKLNDPEQSGEKLFEAIEALGDNIGPVLFQLPPRWHFNAERLEQFLGVLPKNYKYALEFRDRTWLCDEAYEILERHGAAFCMYHLEGFETDKIVTAGHIYIRLHGPGAAYEGEYDKSYLSGWAGAISAWSDSGKEIYIYFDNDQNAYAAKDAAKLKSMFV
ncbi:MAG: DUF72 domain-containing protein [Candidatus Kapaibacterium sp.]